MRPLQAGLHALSLAGCAAIGAGLWTLEREPAPAAAPVRTPAPPARHADPERMLSLEREIESLRQRLKDLEPARMAAPSAHAASSASLLAALDDPRVRERIRAIPGSGGPAAFGASMSSSGDPKDIFRDMDLNPMQRDMLEGIVRDSQREITELFGKLGNGTWTPEQARDELGRRRADADARARTVLTEAQFQGYRERLAPLRTMTDARIGGEHRTVSVQENGFVIVEDPGRK